VRIAKRKRKTTKMMIPYQVLKRSQRNFISELCDVIGGASHKKSYALSIEGKWGSGKISIIKMLSNRLEAEKIASVVNYNPWMYLYCT